LERIKEVFGLDLEIEYGVYKQLPGAIRDGEWTVSVAVWNGKRTLSVEPGVVRHAYGVAVDVGTTKIAGYLLNLRNGEVIGKEAIVNPQIKYGEDVVSRISYATDADKNLERLQTSVIDAVEQIIKDTCAEAGVETRHIYEIVVVGNTVMQHLLLGVSPKYVGRSPYCAVLGSGDFRASDIGLKANANLHTFPVIGGFVGGDHVSAILATKMNESEEMSMLMDIGTNTEIAIGNKEDMISCSCASGPAFEGFYIKHGMRASSGAIEHVEINPETFEVRYRTIEGVRPRGLCGSGLIDLLAELLKTGVMDSTGKLNPEIESNRITTNNDEVEFVVAWERETGIDSDVVITQRDIRELQSAKAAMRAGAEILMLKKGIKEADIDVFYIAGAFGSYVEPANARIIGMYPDVDLERVKIVGNAAGSGAKLALISGEERAHAEEIAKKVRYIELAAEPKFTRCYMLSHYFPFGVALTDIRR